MGANKGPSKKKEFLQSNMITKRQVALENAETHK